MLEISLPKQLFDDWIETVFPNVQARNRSDITSRIHVDFSEVEFVSPLPVLALATEIQAFSAPGREITINLGEGSDRDSAAIFRARTRKFLSLHGLLDSFRGNSSLHVTFRYDRTGEHGPSGETFSSELDFNRLTEGLEKTQGDLLYGTAIVLKATTWRLPKPGAGDVSKIVRKKVEELLRQADTALFRFKTEARRFRDVTLQRLNQILLELVENVAEHAYEGDDAGFVGLYARIRHTRSEAASTLRRTELANSPLLGHLLLSERQHQIEVFVVDVGCGLFAHVSDWDKSLISKADKGLVQHPLRATSRLLFAHPLSRHDRKKTNVSRLRGTSTGLVHLDQILGHQNDVTRIITGAEWLAGPHPRPRGYESNSVSTGGYRLADERIRGTIFHIGISPAEIPAMNAPWFVSDDPTSKPVLGLVAKKFASLVTDERINPTVIDIRLGDGLTNVERAVKASTISHSGTVVRVNRVAEKNLVNQILFSWIQGLGSSQSKSNTLFLCDLGRYQALDIAWVVANSFNKHRIHLKRRPSGAKVILVTEDLCCAQFNLSFADISEGLYNASIALEENDLEKLANKLAFILGKLRDSDSAALWQYVSEMGPATTGTFSQILIEDVLWGSDEGGEPRVLPHYLNFSELVQNTDAARCVRRSLRRLLALYPDANDFPLDGIVASSLHDAKKWLIRPNYDTNHQVLVGSLSVSGTTLNRHRPPPGVEVVGIIDCIDTPYFRSQRTNQMPHLKALLWLPPNRSEKSGDPKYKRLGQSAFVAPIDEKPAVSSSQYDRNLYQVLESSNLLKLGHWSYGDRHSLLDINAELAIEQSGASESGVIPWLFEQLLDLPAGELVVLAFPHDRLAYRLAHHVKSRWERSDSVGSRNLTLLPLSYMPRIAGGLTLFTPLTRQAAQRLSAKFRTSLPSAVFLDIGFITNRTLRHSVRQLNDAGFESVRAFGVLNRSSTPVLAGEVLEKPDSLARSSTPSAYWRWNVPSLGTGLHCPICSSLPNLARLRRVVEEAHIDLMPTLSRIGREWSVKDVPDFWEEHGLVPERISKEIREYLSSVFNEQFGEEIPTTSCTLTARAIELVRLSNDSLFVRQLAGALQAREENYLSTEVLAAYLMMSGGTISPIDLQECVTLLATSTVGLCQIPPNQETGHRRGMLLGLVSLVFASLSNACKLSVLQTLKVPLSSREIVDFGEARIAFLLLTTDSDESTKVQDAFKELCLRPANETVLLRNYYSIRPTKGQGKESWGYLTQSFGRSISHSQQSELGRLRSTIGHRHKHSEVLPRIERIACLLGQCDPTFVMDGLGVDLRSIVLRTGELCEAVRGGTPLDSALLADIENVFSTVAKAVHTRLVRYGDRAEYPDVHVAFFNLLLETCEEQSLELGKHIVVTRDAQSLKWPLGIGDYLPICGHLVNLCTEILSNIKIKSVQLPPPHVNAGTPFEGRQFGAHPNALGWIWFEVDTLGLQKGMYLVFLTGANRSKLSGKYEPKVPGLKELGIRVDTQIHDVESQTYLELRVWIPALVEILEIS